jgi:hypothetical protein
MSFGGAGRRLAILLAGNGVGWRSTLLTDVANPGTDRRAVGSPLSLGTPKGDPAVESLVLTEDEAVELLAYLVSSARTQIDEAAEYGPLRLLTAAQRLAGFIAPRVSPPMRQLLEDTIQQVAQTATLSHDPDNYTAALDAVCAAVAEHLVTRFELDRRHR